MTANHIPDVILERYRLDELPSADAAGVAERLARDPQLAARMKALDASDTALGPAVELAAARLPGRLPVRSRRVMWTMIPATAAVAFVLLAVVLRMDRSAAVPSDDRIKGDVGPGAPALALYRRTPGGSERLDDGALARPCDLIRVGYRAAGYSHGVIISIDGLGNMTMHLAAGDRAIALQQTKTALLDQAYELDDAPRWERFYFVVGNTPFDVAPIVHAVKEAAQTETGTASPALRLPRELRQANFTLLKESRR